jgi:putative ATPase
MATRITTPFPRSSNPCAAAIPTQRFTGCAKMIHAGEDPRFIARRIVIRAAEDVGLADPMALVLANACLAAAEFVGWPEARIPLAEATIYIATANKSNSAYHAIDAALEDVKSGRTIPVPEHLRDGSYKGAKRLGHGAGYQYAHDGEKHFVAQDYLGVDKTFYEPTEQGVEKKIKERLGKSAQAICQKRKVANG